jgi:hypothetical protein
MSHELIRLIDAWAVKTKTTRSEAIRRLVEQALLKAPDERKARKPGSRAPTPRAGVGVAAKMITASGLATSKRSSQMAAEAIDRLGDKSAPVEEQARRKRRLIKGPPEFREMRGQNPKA